MIRDVLPVVYAGRGWLLNTDFGLIKSRLSVSLFSVTFKSSNSEVMA